ncbi:MAG: Uma2 family endonuclease [Dehalococcoidia bacterium]
MTTEKTLYTIDDLYHLPDDGHRYELLDGELVEMAPANYGHGEVMHNIDYLLTAHVRPRRLGRILVGDPGVILGHDPDRVRAPDVAFFARGRFPDGRLPATFSDVVPDLVVEIISPGDRAAAMQQKTEEWLRAGVRLVLNVYPDTRTVQAIPRPDTARAYHDGEAVSLAPVLPDFSLAVTEIFDSGEE